MTPRLNNAKREAVAQLKAQAYLDPENALNNTQIMKKVYGYGTLSAGANAPKVINSDRVSARIKELLQEKITPEYLANLGKKLANFKKYHVDKLGRVIAKTPDGNIQLEAWRTLLKINNVLSDKVEVDTRSVNVNIESVQPQQLIDAMLAIKRMTSQMGLGDQDSQPPATLDNTQASPLVDTQPSTALGDTIGGMGGTPTPPSTSNPPLTPRSEIPKKDVS